MKKKIILSIFVVTVLVLGGVVSTHYVQAQTEFSLFYGPDLFLGSTGQGVVELQGLLSELGYLKVPQGISLGYFGPLTLNALKDYQSSIGVISTGYYGTLTKNQMISVFKAKNWFTLLYPNRA
ncbi:MAG: hypothetical protein COV01_01715 [Candidatus Taylorbacteria bacterium CG10_big_fil_rev_8_21_14_0_10_41_48]|uniref:Peptidoglycan binding-like domain-containing protein n=1 Tax=Candidatus Taylorbacteria bacterium CG10_big_fil_rev_8_21_14_0_10_41_48 TaxID=1975024 RepID=A0A2M8LC44_9BACT|nr:MAG: hypothetical protein COV01_01715 [Candidatus Taylorbacteria bacterium CG10_big_fil_rev_8_21_14_0_10_41_48]